MNSLVDDTLRLVFWELTARCNLSCRHCRAEAQCEAVAGELSTEQILGVARDIREAGDPILILTGGEPLVRPDFYDIARHCSRLFTRVAVATNGTLVDDAIARELVHCGVQRVSISLDGATPATHDAFRGQPGSFDKAIRGFQAMKRAGLSLQINATLTRKNFVEMEQILKLVLDLGADAFHMFVLVPVGCGAEISDTERLSPAEMESALTWLARQAMTLRERIHVKATCAPQYMRIMRDVARDAGIPVKTQGHGMHAVTRGCLAGSSVCFVSRIGDVQPCGYLPVCVGNVLKTPFPEIWRNAPQFLALRDTAQLGGKCGSCGFRKLCTGCRARAYADTGEFLGEDPDCLYVPPATSRPGEPADIPAHPRAG